MLFNDNEDVGVLVTWDYTPDGDVRVNVKSRGNIASEICQKYDGNGYQGSGSFKIKIKSNNMSQYLLDTIWDDIENMNNAFDNAQEDLDNIFKNENSSFTNEKDIITENELGSLLEGLI